MTIIMAPVRLATIVASMALGGPSPPVTPAPSAPTDDSKNLRSWWPVMEGMIEHQLAVEGAAGRDPVLFPNGTSTTTIEVSATMAPTSGPEDEPTTSGLGGESEGTSSGSWQASRIGWGEIVLLGLHTSTTTQTSATFAPTNGPEVGSTASGLRLVAYEGRVTLREWEVFLQLLATSRRSWRQGVAGLSHCGGCVARLSSPLIIYYYLHEDV
ncbi:hypothetical protein FOZ62_025329 [Perkinsus olseni]|uniref:Secreted protein n=1 Tax=Perkinsus olseni TaxID=32597 RepID=A0A7J6SKR2_PEROL|nr:hypothetical protein FOZ62_025329 [Perkinsus olseni]